MNYAMGFQKSDSMKVYSVFFAAILCIVGCSNIPGSFNQTGMPVFSETEGIYGHPINVMLTCATAGAVIHYTLNGTAPDSTSPVYASPLTLGNVGTTYKIKASAFCSGMVQSDIAEITYIIVRAGTEDTLHWDKLFDDTVGVGITVTSDSNICSVGFGVNADNSEAAIIKLFSAADGTEKWEKTIDSSLTSDRALKVCCSASGNLYVGGTSLNLVSAASGVDWTLREFDLSGNAGWFNYYDAGFGNDYVNTVKVDSHNDVYIGGSGYNRVAVASKDDWWIKKFSSDGTEYPEWNLSFDGNSDEDYVNEIAFDSSDNVYIAGCGKNLCAADSGFDWRVKKMTRSGTLIWEKKYDGNKGDDYINAITVDPADNVYLVGNGQNLVASDSMEDWWIKKLNPDGDLLWEKTYDGNRGNDYLNSATVDAQGYLYVVGAGYIMINGTSNYDWWIEKRNPDGVIDTVYTKTFDDTQVEYYANTIVVDSGNNIYVTGCKSYQLNGITKKNWWIKKFYN